MDDEKDVCTMLTLLLDNDSGISEEAYKKLQKAIFATYKGHVPKSIADIYNKVEATDGMFYLPKGN